MKKYSIIIIAIIISFISCQDVVEVDLKTAQERLVIEAMIKWEKGTLGNNQVIKLTKTSSFYNNQITYATGATVLVTNTANLQSFVFNETTDGLYMTSTFVPVLNTVYELKVIYKGQTYKATDTLFESPNIASVTQSIENGFDPIDPEVNVFFQDFLNQEDYYRIIFVHTRTTSTGTEDINTNSLTYDASFEENNILSEFYEYQIKVDDHFDIYVYKISKQFYNFLEVLEAQADAGFGPFSSPPVNVKGNIINVSNPENYPYGYFGLNQISKEVYVFQ